MTSSDTFVPHKRFVTVQRAEKWWVENARINPEIFIHYCLKLQPALHHKMWLSYFFNPDYKLVNIVAARFSAKTTISVLAKAWVVAKSPGGSNMIVSVSEEQAVGRIAELKFLIGENPAFRNVFPHVEIDTRRPITQDAFSLVDTSMSYANWSAFRLKSRIHPTFKGRGSGGSGIIGARVTDVMLLDDIVDGKEMTIAAHDKKEKFIIDTLMPCIHPDSDGRIWNIGTRWMAGDIYGRFIENPAWHSLTIPAILHDEEGIPYSYWPEYWPLSALETKRKEMNNDVLFGIMFLCTPAETTLGLFPLELFEDCVVDLTKIRDDLDLKYLFITTDFAVSVKTRADWNVLYAVGITQDDRLIVLDGLRYKLQPVTNIDTIIEFCHRINDSYGAGIGLSGVLVEKVAFQAVFAHFIAEKSVYLPVKDVVPIGDKDARARPIRDYMLMQRLLISDKLPFLDIMKNEFVSMGFARYDDTIDPLGLLLQHLSKNHIRAIVRTIKDPFKI